MSRERRVIVSVTDETNDGVWVATDTFSKAFGEGDTPLQALRDWAEDLTRRIDDMRRYKGRIDWQQQEVSTENSIDL